MSGDTPVAPSAPAVSAPHAVVIGGGVVGLTTAYLLSRCGHRVTVVEQQSEARKTQWPSAALLAPSQMIPLQRKGNINLLMMLATNPLSWMTAEFNRFSPSFELV